MESWRRPFSLRPLVRATLAVATLGAAFACGWFARGGRDAQPSSAMRMIREQGATPWRFINPLLECDAGDDTIQRPTLLSFRQRLAELVDSRKAAGDIGFASIYFRELNDGPSIGVNRSVGYVPASLLKLPTLIAVLKRAERDPSFLERRVVFTGLRDDNDLIAFRPPGNLEPGQSYRVVELCRRMVRFSDNNATGLLNELIPRTEQDEALRGLGVLPEMVAREGRLTVRTVSSFLRVLYNASYLSREHSETALQMLSEAYFRDGIIRGVPDDVRVCSKYGEAAPGPNIVQLHEFAIVYHNRRPYLLGVMTQGSDFTRLAGFIRDTSRLVYEEVERQSSLEPRGNLPDSGVKSGG